MNGSTATQPTRDTQVQNCLDTLSKAVARGQELAIAIENRLLDAGVLLLEDQAKGEGSDNLPKRTLVPLAVRIDATTSNIEATNDKLEYMLRRLEL